MTELTEEIALTLKPGTVLHRTTKGYEWTREVHEVTTVTDEEDTRFGQLDQILFVPLPDKPVPPWAHDAISVNVFHEWVVGE